MSQPSATEQLTLKPYAALALGVASASVSAILIRLADAPPLVIGFWRLTLASLLLTPVALWVAGDELRHLPRRDLRLALLSGVFLGLHFATWITSLEYTSVASSVVLVTTAPIFVGLASPLLLHVKLERGVWLGILLSIAGGVIISFGDMTLSGRALLGDLLALLGAMAISAYFLIGRQLRRRLSLLAYVLPTYWMAAVVLALAAWAAGDSFGGYTAQTWLMLLLLAIFPQIIGHSLMNWSLRHVSPTMVTVSNLAEPIFATILAYFVLAETPTPVKAIGGMLVLGGIYVTMQEERQKETPRA